MLKICLTYDYELFLGRNHASPEEILFNPTRHLIDVMCAYGVSGTFFVYVCSAICHRDRGLNDYAESFDRQIQDMLLSNQDVQLHIHPSWFYAEKNNDSLVLTSKGYRIHEFGFSRDVDRSAPQIILEGKTYLEKVCRAVKPSYQCVGFRAGGFALQPEQELLKVLLDNGIRIDSSVVPNMKHENSVNVYDYTNVPRELNWWMNPDEGIKVSSRKYKESMFEVPVMTARPRLLGLLMTTRIERSLPKGKLLGEYVTESGISNKRTNKLKRIYHSLCDYRYISLDTRYYERIFEDLEFFYQKYGLDKQDGYVCLISHPKLADQARIDNIEHLIRKVSSEKGKFEFVTIEDVYNEVADSLL